MTRRHHQYIESVLVLIAGSVCIGIAVLSAVGAGAGL